MATKSNLSDGKSIDHENLSIIIHPKPPRRRQSGTSLVPFRPYVKSLTSVREPFSYANGQDPWTVIGQPETFFKQDNARCIGSLIDDCDVSDVIRWDIEAESTRLPMMCKLWIIVDGAVVERGKPHLVQDAAIQVLTVGRNLRSILASEQRKNLTPTTKSNRRRRQSWHDVNEYHSVPYYQYTRSVRSGYHEHVQCDLDLEYSTSRNLESLDETIDEHIDTSLNRTTNAVATIHIDSTLENHTLVSVTTQTERELKELGTSVDLDFLQLFNLNLETNENLLSSVVDPNIRYNGPSTNWEINSFNRAGRQYKNQSISTGDDYPHWWLQLSTNIILSEKITRQGESKVIEEKPIRPASPPQVLLTSPRSVHEQSVQTDVPISPSKERPSSSKSTRLSNASSPLNISSQYQFIDHYDDGNNNFRLHIYPAHRSRHDSQGDFELTGNESPNSYVINPDGENKHRTTSTSKHSETDYHTFASDLNRGGYSTPDNRRQSVSHHTSFNEAKANSSRRTPNPAANISVDALLERYERTLRDRQRALTIINNQSMFIDDLIEKYRGKLNNSSSSSATNTAENNQTREDRQVFSTSLPPLTSERPSSSFSAISNTSRVKNASTRTDDDDERALQISVRSPRVALNSSIITLPRQIIPRADLCDLSLSDGLLSTAWIRYNERRIDEVQKRIDLMLQIDDNEEAQLLLSNFHPTRRTVTEHIDDILVRRSRGREHLGPFYERILLPRRNRYQLPYRLNQTTSNTPRNTSRPVSRSVSRSTTPVIKSVRISTKNDFIPDEIIPDEEKVNKPSPRPIVSILRRTNTTFPAKARRLLERNHVWKNDADGKVYIMDQFSIPRYYRLYNDVGFREVYQFSRLLETYLDRHERSPDTYSTMIKTFAVEHQLPTELTL